jgi:alpha-glucoside transport system permease protein
MRTKPIVGWIFLLPALTLLVLFLIYPTLRTIQLSFDTGRGFTLSENVGLKNYIDLFTQDRLFFDISRWPFKGAVFNTAIWLILYTAGTVGLGLSLAILSNTVRYEVIFKTIIFIPMGISFTAAGIIWRFVYSPDSNIGVLNAMLVNLLRAPSTVPWLGRGDLVNICIIIAAIWTSTGFALVVFSAAIKGLPAEVMEASLVDGANSWQRFWRIMLPMLWPTTIVLITTSIISVLKAFDLVFIMTNGGPRGLSQIIGFTMYDQTFRQNKPGYGSAVAVIMLLLVLPFVVFNIRRFRSEG